MKIFLGNLPYSMTENELQILLETYGTVLKTNLAVDRETGRPRGFGFAEMPDPAQANAAIAALNGQEISGRKLTVNEARPKNTGSGKDSGRNCCGVFRKLFRKREIQ